MIIDHNGTFIHFWNPFHVFCCLTSSYMYGYKACFRDDIDGMWIILFETVFLTSMLIEFFTDFDSMEHLGM